jgi:Zn-dependent peptidase ImmA (M78 family)/transcriptional regulator with XRE-family HTH domain
MRGMLKTDLADGVGLTPAAIGQFERGVVHPKAASVARLALVLRVPPEFFIQRPIREVPEDEAHFRRLRATSKRARDEARAHVELLADLVAYLEQRVRLPEVALPPERGLTSPAQAAAGVRDHWGLGLGPISSMTGLLERKGTIVARVQTSSEDVDAFSCWIGGRPFVLLASNKESPDRSRFDAAHELGHLLMHHDVRPGDPDAELQAHAFAAEFLMPEAQLRAELPDRLNWRRYLELKARWGVSLAALVRRARDLGVTSEASYRRAMIALGQRGWRQQEPAAGLEAERPELVRRAIELLQAGRHLSLDGIALEIAIPTEDVAMLAAMADAGPDPEMLRV